MLASALLAFCVYHMVDNPSMIRENLAGKRIAITGSTGFVGTALVERLIEAAKAQLDRVTLTSRAFYHDRFGDFCEQLAELCGMEMVLPMNTGAEAVETAVKTARKWGYRTKGVRDGRAKIIVADNNFHGRTTTIVSFSTDEEARAEATARDERSR